MKKLLKNVLVLTLSSLLIFSSLSTGLVALSEDTIPSYYGTAEKGIMSDVTSYPHKLKPVDGINNLDFENGYIYWSGRNANISGGGTYAFESFKMINDTTNNNKYITMLDTGAKFTDGTDLDGLQTVLFKVTNVSAGDKVAVVFDAKGTDVTKIRPYVMQIFLKKDLNYSDGLADKKASSSSSQLSVRNDGVPTELSLYTAANGWKTYATQPNGSRVIATPDTSICVEDIYLQLMVTYQKDVVAEGDKLDIALDNFRIVKINNGVYTDLATNEVIYDPANPPTPPEGGDDNTGDDNGEDENKVYPPVITPPSYYGTEADGFNSVGSSWPMALKPSDYIYNLDFEMGFIYWSGKKYKSVGDPGSLASDSFKLVNDGTNKYITLKYEGYVNTMRTALFKASNVKVGDELVLIYDAKGDDANKIRVTLVQDHIRGSQYVTYNAEGLNTTSNNPSPGNSNTLVGASTSLKEITEIDTPAGWTTYITGSTATVNDPETLKDKEGNLLSKPCTADIYLQIIIEGAEGVVVGDKLDVAIDNIRIAKVVNNVYIDVATNKVICDSSAIEVPASSISVATLPETECLQGEKINLTNGTLLVDYPNGTSQTVNMTQTMLSGYDAKKLGKQTVTVTYRGCITTFDVYVTINPEAELAIDVLVWLVNIILADETDRIDADLNNDGGVDILDVVFVKKQLVNIALNKTYIDGPLYMASSKDPYSGKIVRYELHDECKGWYFTPKAEGTYKTVILIHGSSGPENFTNNLLSAFNYWVKNGYIEPMVVIIPEVYDDDKDTVYSTWDHRFFMNSSKTNRFALLLNSIQNGTLSAKIDKNKSPMLAGFSLGGLAALHGGVQFKNKIEKIGALSPAQGFYYGDGNQAGIYVNASDIYFSSSDNASILLSAGLAEDNGSGHFVANIDRFETAIAVNNPGITTKFKAPSSWGGHAWELTLKEIFMFVLFATQNDKLPTEEWVETACNSVPVKIPTVVTDSADEHK